MECPDCRFTYCDRHFPTHSRALTVPARQWTVVHRRYRAYLDGTRLPWRGVGMRVKVPNMRGR